MMTMPPRTSVRAKLSYCLMTLIGAATALIILTLGASPVDAKVDARVRNACMSDYFAYCAGLEVGSQELRRCMNKAGPKLQPSCVSALVAAGEVSQAEVNRRSGAKKKMAQKPRGGSKAAIRTASRSACISGPARPGAKASSSCRVGAGKGAKGRGQFALR